PTSHSLPLLHPRPPTPTLFPYTTLFRSPSTALVEGPSLQADRAFPHREHVRRVIGRALLQAWNPSLGRLRTPGLFDPGLDQTDPRFGAHQLRHPHERRVVGQPGVVVEKEQELTVDVRDAGIAPSRDPEILWKSQRLDLLWDAFRFPAVADTDDVEFDSLLRQKRFESAVEFVQSLALAQHDDAE